MLYYSTVKLILREKRGEERKSDRRRRDQREREREEEWTRQEEWRRKEKDCFITKHKVNDDTARISELDTGSQRKIFSLASIWV